MDATEPVRLLLAAGALASLLLVVSCAPSGELSVAATEIAERVVAHVERTLDVTPEVDCGTKTLTLVDGDTVRCRVIDPETGEVSDATVRIVASEPGNFDIDLSVQGRDT